MQAVLHNTYILLFPAMLHFSAVAISEKMKYAFSSPIPVMSSIYMNFVFISVDKKKHIVQINNAGMKKNKSILKMLVIIYIFHSFSSEKS